MSTETITFINFIVHSLIIGAAAWLLVRFVISDALRRCILANLAVLMCLYNPFDTSIRDLFPVTQHVPVLTPIRETLEHDWRVKVEPQKAIVPSTPAPAVASSWDVNELVKWLHRLSWFVTALLLLRMLIQSLRIQRWSWRLRALSADEAAFLRDSVLEPERSGDRQPEAAHRVSAANQCAGPPALSNVSRPSESSRGLEHSKTLSRMRVSDMTCTPCAAGWFFPVIAVPVSAFHELTPPQWRWLLRHEMEHLRTHDTVSVLLQNIVLAFLWWNPFVHALIEEYARAREEACDAAAVGEEPDHTPYADFLLSWAARTSPSRFAMPIARSRPARRLKDRLVALMEARGVRQKLGALFVLGCLAFAVVAPFVAASFGIATATAQETVKADPEDKTMFTRVYVVEPDFLALGHKLEDPFATPKGRDPFAAVPPPEKLTARELLEKNGIPFPEGSSVIYQASTSRLIVRHTRAVLDQIEAAIDRLHQRLPQVYFQCRLIQADALIGKHESILKPDEAKELLAGVSQKTGIDLMSAPGVTTKMGRKGIVEVMREILPAKPWAQDAVIEVKRVGPRISLVALPSPDGEASIEAKVDLGVDPEAQHPWLPEENALTDWSRIQTFTVSSKAVLASGETLLLHLPTSNKPVTVLITAEALNPNGQRAISFESTATLQPSKTASDVADKATGEWMVRVFQLPKGFSRDKPPVEMLRAAGIAFPEGASAMLKDGKLTVRNSEANLKFIVAWLDALIQAEAPKKHVHLTVLAAEMNGDLMKMMNEWLEPSAKPFETAAPPAVLRQFTMAGVITATQMEKVVKRLAADAGAKLEVIKPKQKSQMYDLPAAWGGHEMKIEPVIGPDGYTIDMMVHAPAQAPDPRGISTSVTIWDGQTVLLSAQPTEEATCILFITGTLVAPLAEK